MKYYFLLICFTLVYKFSIGKEVIIDGKIPGAEGKEIRAYSYTDLITYNEKLISKTNIDKNGNFSIKTNIDNISIFFLRVDFYKSVLFVEPGKTYKLLYDTLNPKKTNEYENPFLFPQTINFKIVNAGSEELNDLINKFDSINAKFVADNAVALMKKRNKKVVENFKIKIDSAFKGVKNEYLLTYIKYKTAGIEEAMSNESRKSLFENYIYKKPILINNVGYMEFFNQYFNKFFTNVTQNIKFIDLETVINDQKSYSALMDTLGKDSVLRNELLREMVLIKGLSELYNVPGFNKENIISILTSLTEKSKFKDNKNIAFTTIKYLSGYPTGTLAADFSLTDKKLKSFSLSQNKGKYIYLFFWNTSCSVCMSEMNLLNELKKKYADKLEIIGISIDIEPFNMYYFLEKHKYDFPVLHFAYNYNLLDSYYVRNLPFFVLIDTEGNIVNCPAVKPSENIDQQIDIFINKK